MVKTKRKVVSKKNKNRRKKQEKRNIILLCAGIVLILCICLGVFVFKKSNIVDDELKKINAKKSEKKINVVDVNSNTRNVAVMINNIKTVWGYQSGIQDAYIVYEIITEGGITRLMGIFKDADTARVGTIRSARAYYIDYVLENDAVYVHIGGSPGALSDIRNLGVNDLQSEVTWREKNLGLAFEHTAFASMEKINAKIKSRGYRSTTDKKLLLDYSADEIDLSSKEDAKPANKVLITFSNSKNTSFEYDSENKVYKRYQNSKEHVDYVSKKQYTVKNIITYQVSNSSIAGDLKGRQVLNNIGKGNGYYISNGYAVPITWEKSSRESQTVYKYTDGTVLKVNDGNTHIEIQPTNKTIEIN